MSFEAFNFIDKKKAGMSILCSKIAENLETQAKNNAPWSSSDEKTKNQHARQGLNGGSECSGNNYSIYLAHGVDYGKILEDGSEPHVITPKNGVHLYWKGAVHPVKKVNHPGTKGFKHLEKTLNNNKSIIKSAVIEYWSD